MFPDGQEGNITEGDISKIAQVAVGKDHAGNHVRIHAMIRAPVIGIGFQRNGGNFAESGFSGAAISGCVSNHEVRTEAGIGTGISLMFEANLLDDRLSIGILPIQQFAFDWKSTNLQLIGLHNALSLAAQTR